MSGDREEMQSSEDGSGGGRGRTERLGSQKMDKTQGRPSGQRHSKLEAATNDGWLGVLELV